MSYSISLIDKDGSIPKVERFCDGGTYVVGGSEEAELNVTYNYCKHFSFRNLNKRKAKFTIAEMGWAVQEFGTELDVDYWNPTPGNVGAAIARLLSWARQHLDCVWLVQ